MTLYISLVWTMLVLLHRARVEAKLHEQGISRHDIGRENFLCTTLGSEKYIGKSTLLHLAI